MERIGAQGEIMIDELKSLPSFKTKPATEKNAQGQWIISHSEQGNHHVLDGGARVLERVEDVPRGMRIFYAILDGPGQLVQDTNGGHESYDLAGKFYEFRISREYDPFAEQARRVAD